MIKRVGLFLLCMGFLHAEIILDEPHFLYDHESQIEAGAKAFKQTCFSCHTMKLMRTDPISMAAGITSDAAPVWDSSSWNGHPPPDLSLITAVKGVRYVYGYLQGYYKDDSNPSGYSNAVLPSTQMPNPFAALQGNQELVVDLDQVDFVRLHEALRLKSTGDLTPGEFNRYLTSIVAYLDFSSDPSVHERRWYGWFVVMFVGVFVAIMVVLDLLYWRDIHQKKEGSE